MDGRVKMVYEKPNGYCFKRAFINSLSGIKSLWQHEKSFRLEVYCSIVLIPLIFLLHIPDFLRSMLLILLILLLVVEAINSAIEAVVDRISLEIHDKSRLAKDTGSAAVGLVIFLNVLFWLYAIFIQFV